MRYRESRYYAETAFSLILASLRGTGPASYEVRQYGPLNPLECISALIDVVWAG